MAKIEIKLDHAAAGSTDRNPDAPFTAHTMSGRAIWHVMTASRHVDPLALEPDAIMTVLRFPIERGNGGAIGVEQHSPSASEAVEPGLERRVA